MYKIERLVTDIFQENIWFIINSDNKVVIIDPGFMPLDALGNFFEKNQLKPIAIVNTHAHPDHIYAVHELQQTYEIPFYLYESEKANLDNCLNLSQAIGVNDFQLPQNITYFNETELIIDGFQFKVFHTPGHTKGSICLKFGNHMISGDTLFQGSIGRVDLPGGSMAEMNESIKIFKEMNDEIIIYPGHGNTSTIGEEKRNNPYF